MVTRGFGRAFSFLLRRAGVLDVVAGVLTAVHPGVGYAFGATKGVPQGGNPFGIPAPFFACSSGDCALSSEDDPSYVVVGHAPAGSLLAGRGPGAAMGRLGDVVH